ncbi:MAG: pilus (MSHA type) biogenesis protein MshL [Magnetococcales bacterium]|nr:pilus (MSHA type) biogenesis protein MshL [Magnetococcales bacterium]
MRGNKLKHGVLIGCLSIALLTLWGCAAPGQPSPEGAQTSPTAQPLKASPPSLGRLPPHIDAALLPPPQAVALQTKKPVAAAPLIDVVVDAVPAKSLFMALAEQSQLNVVVHPDVGGTITMNLSRITIPQAIDTVCMVYDFDCQRTEQGYLIQPSRLLLRQYHIDYLRLQREGLTRTKVSAGQSVSNTSTNTNKGATTKTENVESAGSHVVTRQQSHFWQEFVLSLCGVLGLGFSSPDGAAAASPSEPATSALAAGTMTGASASPAPSRSSSQSMLSWNPQSHDTVVMGCAERNAEGQTIPGRRIVVTPQTGEVLVRAYPRELRDIETYLAGQKKILERQVILEAKILEINLNDGFQTGINWSVAFANRRGVDSTVGMTGGGSLMGDSGTNPLFADSTEARFSPSNLNNTMARRMFGGAFTLAADLSDFTSLIELLKTQGKVQVLSSPRVATINNQKAVIRVGQDELFVTDVEAESSSSANSSSVMLIPKFSTFFSGIALDVTPQIASDGKVMLHIHPMVSEVTTDQKQVTIGSEVQSYPLALNRVRESDSMVQANNGEVVVIGGLMKDIDINRKASVPLLGDIPVLGRLFSHDQEVARKSELVILLRPWIVTGDSVWRQEAPEAVYDRSGLVWHDPAVIRMLPNPGLDALKNAPGREPHAD